MVPQPLYSHINLLYSTHLSTLLYTQSAPLHLENVFLRLVVQNTLKRSIFGCVILFAQFSIFHLHNFTDQLLMLLLLVQLSLNAFCNISYQRSCLDNQRFSLSPSVSTEACSASFDKAWSMTPKQKTKPVKIG